MGRARWFCARTMLDTARPCSPASDRDIAYKRIEREALCTAVAIVGCDLTT